MFEASPPEDRRHVLSELTDRYDVTVVFGDLDRQVWEDLDAISFMRRLIAANHAIGAIEVIRIDRK